MFKNFNEKSIDSQVETLGNKAVQIKNIPDAMKTLNQWVAWKKILNGKKIPVNPTNGVAALVNDAATWTTFENALGYYQSGKADGVGFVFTNDDPFIGIDFDDCIVDGKILPEIASLVKKINSYTEISPSGEGLHIIIKGKLPAGGHRKGKVEVYDKGRFFTVTGNSLPDTTQEIINVDNILDILFQQAVTKHNISDGDAAMLGQAFKKQKFNNLWNGNIEGYTSHSEADLALCRMIGYYCSNDLAIIDRIFRKSGLFRSKWNEVHSFDGKTYGQMTIEKALTNIKNDTDNNKHKTFNLSDLGNAERMAHYHSNTLKYCHHWEKWMVWDGTRWSEDGMGIVNQIAKATVRGIYNEAQKTSDDSKRQAIVKHAISSESNGRIKSMVSLAKSELPILPAQFDKDLYLLNCQNGTVNLKTGQLLPHDKDNFITKIAPVKYDEDATCPVWEQFLLRVMDGNLPLINFLQRVVGYSLTGDVSEQCLFLLWGAGANGKSTFLRTISNMLGDYSQNTSTDTLLVKKQGGIPNDVARMKGARFITASESEAEHRLAENLIKQMTGDDVLTARFLHQEFFEFKPEYKIFLATNNRPIIKGTDNAIWRRIKLIPFEVSIPAEERDKQLLNKLEQELSGILNWAIAGCLDWLKNGIGVPPEVINATDDYRQEMDTVGNFISDCCVVGEDLIVTSSDLYSAYTKWCEVNSEYQIRKNTLWDKFREKGFTIGQVTKKRVQGWRGLSIKIGTEVLFPELPSGLLELSTSELTQSVMVN